MADKSGRARAESAPGLGPFIRSHVGRSSKGNRRSSEHENQSVLQNTLKGHPSSRQHHQSGSNLLHHGQPGRRHLFPLGRCLGLLILAVLLFLFIGTQEIVRINLERKVMDEMHKMNNIAATLPASKWITLDKKGKIATNLFNSELEKAFITVQNRFFTCDGCYVDSPRCDVKLISTPDYLPDPRDLFPVDRETMDIVIAAFSKWMCYLPATTESSLTSECTYRSATMDNFFCENTVAKMLKRWGDILLRYGVAMQYERDELVRLVYRQDFLKDEVWRWGVEGSDCSFSKNPGEQFLQDPCPWTGQRSPNLRGKKRDQLALTLMEMDTAEAILYIDKIIRELANRAITESSISSTIFFQGLSLRYILENHIGGCLKARVKAMLKKVTVVRPLFPDGSEKLEACSGVSSYRDSPAISIHIRRGDACEKWSDKPTSADDHRYCFLTEAYFRAALKMKRLYGACQILLSTDSDEVKEELQRFANSYDFYITILDFGRKPFNPDAKGKKGFIENREMPAESRNTVTVSAIAELFFLSKGSMLIGTGSSTITRIVHQLLTVYTGRIPPFISLDFPLDMYEGDSGCEFKHWL